jgi:demethylspheroidene O-methyltransferase
MTTSDRKPGWRDQLYASRNRLLAHPRFQRWASTFPLTRSIAKNRAGGLFDLCAGFVYSQILFACVDLKLFEALAGGPVALDALATKAGLSVDAMRRLLDAAAALDLVEKRGALYGLGVHGAAYLGNAGIGAMIAHHAMLYRDLADPVALLKAEAPKTELSQFWPYASAETPHDLDAEAVAPYSALMSVSLAMIADDVLDAYPFVDHSCLLDIGGGGGDFLVAAAHRRPDLHLILFDLPAVAARAEARFVRERLSGRSQAIGGDFKRDSLPGGADLVSLVRIAHDLDDAALDALLAKIFAALPAGGILLLAEPLAETAGAERVGAYFEFYLLAMQRGRPRTADDLTQRLYAAGFVRVRCIATPRPMLTGLLVAQKSAGPRNRAVLQD